VKEWCPSQQLSVSIIPRCSDHQDSSTIQVSNSQSYLKLQTDDWKGLRFQHMMSSPTCNLKGSFTHTQHLALKQYFSCPRLLIYSYQAPPINVNPNNKRSKLTNNKSFGPVNIFEHSRAGVKLCCDVRLCSGLPPVSTFWAKLLNPSYFIHESVVANY
jgi:hypothetical protein